MLIDSRGLRLVVTDYHPGERMAPHRHPGTQVSMVMRGAVEEGVAGREHQGGVGAVVVKPAGVVHRNVFGPAPVRMLSINLLPGHGLEAERRSSALSAWRWTDGGPASRALWRLLATARAEPAHASALLADAFWEMVDALDVDGAAVSPSTPPAWLRRIREQLHDSAGAAPPVRVLAEAAGVHPVYLARAFRRAYGVPVTEYARRLRIRAAADRVACTGLPLARIACEAGFADQSHLTRELRRETGLTPGALRRAAATPPVESSAAA